MHVYIFLSPFNASSYGLHISLALVSAALIGFGWQGGFSSLMFTPALSRGWHLPIWLFCFTRYSTPWIFSCASLSDMSDLNIQLKAQFRSGGSFSFSMSMTFSEWVPKLSEFFSGCFRVSCLVCTIQSLWGYPLLSPDFWYPTANLAAFFQALDRTKRSLVFLVVFWSSTKDCSANASNVLRSLHLAFCFLRLMTEKVFAVFLPSLRVGFLV